MLITIYDSVGNPKVDISPNDSSTQVKAVQSDSVLTLSFTHYDHIDLDVDDYADFLGERFWLTEKYRPRQNAKKEWVYDLKLYGVESMIKRLLVIKTVDDEDNPVFTLTAPPRDHVAMIVKCMNDGMGNITDWKVGQVNGTENIVIDYFGKYCDEALKEIAEKVGAEWWVEGQTVNICKCEHGEPVELGYNKGLLSIDPGTANNVKFYTRLYPVGSSRNIDPEKYGFTRLQLPGGQKYVEINADKYGRVDHFEQSAFENIYPRRVGSVSSVRSEVKTGEDGNPFTIYYFSDNSLPFDPNDYMIGGLVIRASFQEGSELAGLGEEEGGTFYFEVNFNSTTREFEIITIWPYDNDIQLPGDKLVPKAGDKYILWNLRMPDEYYTLAEEEFLTAVNKYNADHSLDISVYKAPTDHVWIEDNNVELTIGRRVRLESEQYFPGSGFRNSRITRITRKVNLPSSMDIEIGDALSRTSQEKIADSITDVRSFAQSIGTSVSLPDIIRTGDATRPTDNNLLSALRVFRDLLRKDRPDRTPYGLSVGGRLHAESGTHFGRFVSGYAGGAVDSDGNGELESLTVRSYLKVFELIYNRLNAQEGEFSFADVGTIDILDENADGSLTATMRKRWEGDFTAFQPGDIIYGYINDLDKATAKEYGKAWGRVTSVNRTANTLAIVPYADTDVPSGHNLGLTAEMVISRWGNAVAPSEQSHANPDYASFIVKKGGRWVNTRQQSFFISCEQGDIVELMGVDAPKLREGNYGMALGQIPEGLLDDDTAALINPGQPYLFARGIVVQDLIRINYKGVKIRTPNFRGAWSATEAADEDSYYRMADDIADCVSHDGCIWQCVSEHASATAPSDTNADWIRLTARTQSEWRIVPGVNTVYIRSGSESTDCLTCAVRHYGADGSEDITTPEALDPYGVKLLFTLDGTQYSEFWVRSGAAISGTGLQIGGNNVPWAEINDSITLTLRDTAGGEDIEAYTVPVVKDGADGEKGDTGDSVENRYRVFDGYTLPSGYVFDGTARIPSGWALTHGEVLVGQSLWQTSARIDGKGNLIGGWSTPARLTGEPGKDGKGEDGKDGKVGLLAYPAGVFDPLVTYKATATSTPVVMDGQDGQGLAQYYVLARGKTYYAGDSSVQYKTPHEDAVANGGYWSRMDRFCSVFADILMAEFAKLASAVFSGDLMFSQQGRDAAGAYSDDYRKIHDGFDPNFAVDFKTGRLTARFGEFSGYVRQRPTAITPDNIGAYLKDGMASACYMDWRKTGTCVLVKGDFGDDLPQMWLPQYAQGMTASEIDSVRGYLGSTATVMCSGGASLGVNVLIYDRSTDTCHDTSVAVASGKCVTFRCVLSHREGSDTEEIAWERSGIYNMRS